MNEQQQKQNFGPLASKCSNLVTSGRIKWAARWSAVSRQAGTELEVEVAVASGVQLI